jgi:hypothetical protein
VTLVSLVFAQGSISATEKVEVKVVKYADLAATVRQNKGKVIVVDLWASW